jgi:hypothetical protein
MIAYKDVLIYLDAIADATGGNIDGSPHGRWWKKPATDAHGNPIPGQLVNLTYDEFKKGSVTGGGIAPPVPIVDPGTGTDKSQSSFYQILLGKYSFGGKTYRKMPDGGPFITDSAADSGTGDGTTTTPGSIVYTLSDGITTFTGKKIQDDLLEWLKAGAPE